MTQYFLTPKGECGKIENKYEWKGRGKHLEKKEATYKSCVCEN